MQRRPARALAKWRLHLRQPLFVSFTIRHFPNARAYSNTPTPSAPFQSQTPHFLVNTTGQHVTSAASRQFSHVSLQMRKLTCTFLCTCGGARISPAESVITKSQWEGRTTLKHILFDLTSEDILSSQANKPPRVFWIVPTSEGKGGEPGDVSAGGVRQFLQR